MFRDILSSRAIVIGVVFFVVVVGSSLLYSWHVRRTTDAEFASSDAVLEQRENSNETCPAADTVDTSTVDFEQEETLLETKDTQHINKAAEVFTEDDIFVANDMLNTFIEETDATEGAPYGVSPFGFGPFPEIPPDYPDQDIWNDTHTSTGMEPYSELVIRTRIALWNQGVRTVGAIRDNTYNLIYPIIDDVVYIKWADNLGPDGEPYVQRVLTSPTTDDSYDLHKGIFPPHLTIYEFPDGGIDPYDFLGLPR